MISSSLLCQGAAALLFATSAGLAVPQDTDASTAPHSVPTIQDLTLPVLETGVPLDLQWPAGLAAARPSAPAVADAGSLPASGALSIAETMTEPLVTEPSDGRIWARTRSFRASYGDEGLTVLPVFGARSPQEWPVRFMLDSVRLGTNDLTLASERPRRIEGGIETEHGAVREVHHLRVGEIEQTFVFDSLPGSGDLEVQLAVETELTPRVEGETLRFEHPEFGHVSYGEAFVVDGKGTKAPIERRWTGDGISLVVPSEFLANAVLPVTIDPVITSFSSGFGASDDSFPDVCYAGFAQQYCVVWQEFTSATNADVYWTSFNTAGVQGSSYAIEVTSDYWRDPQVAYIPAGGRLLVVATHNFNGPGTGSESIKGQLVQASDGTLVGPDFFISSQGQNKANPVVGGTNYLSVTNNHFMVAWSRLTSSSTARIESRIINWDGAAITGIQTIDSQTGVFSVQPAISASYGDATLDVDLWTLAWIRDDDGNGRGDATARRVPWNGNLNAGQGVLSLTNSNRCSFPTVTSRHDEFLPGTSDRPSIVAWQERLFAGTLVHHDIFASVLADGSSSVPVNLTRELEDLNTTRDQIRPSIATDGKCFLLTYAERTPMGSTASYDMFMVSGNVAKPGSFNRMALSERHQVMGSSTTDELYGRVAMQQDGDGTLTNNGGAAVWIRRLASGPDRGELVGTTLICGTNPLGDARAVGVQYCDAIRNSVGEFQGDETSSWFRIHGSGTVNDTANFRCVDTPPNVFGYFITSLTPGDVAMPGGSSGRLCLGGAVGRFSNTVLTSGSDGAVEMTFSPQFIPQPSGPVAAQPGETWYFQYWHRDAGATGATSNFSNGCSLTFQP